MTPVVLEIKPLQTLTHVLVTSNVHDKSIKNEQETSLLRYKSMVHLSDTQGKLPLQKVVGSGQNSNSSKILCMSL